MIRPAWQLAAVVCTLLPGMLAAQQTASSDVAFAASTTRAAHCTADSAAVAAITNAPSADLVNDCNILLDAKETLESPDGHSLNWSVDRSMAQWTAIVVSANRVSKIDSLIGDEQTLFSNSLLGEMPPELGNLSELTVLRLQNVGLQGEIPDELGNLTNLRTLDLGSNRNDLLALGGGVTGTIPASLGDLSRLETLDLSGNKLVGDIPLSLRRLTSLEVLDLGNNVDRDVFQRPRTPLTGLQGVVPPELAELRNLRELDLAFNRLTGEVPRELGGLEKLNILNLARNFLTGCVPGSLRDFKDVGGLFTGINPQRNADHDQRTRDLPLCPAPDRPTVAIESAVGGEMIVSYSATSGDGAPISGFEYRLSADGGTTWDPDWTAIPDSAPGEPNASSFKLRGLIDGTEYTLEVRAVSIDGAGPSASVRGTPMAHAAATLIDLVLSHGTTVLTPSPAFASNRYSYTVMVGDAVEVLTIVATPARADATVDSNPQDDDDARDGIQVRLDPGFNTIVLTVGAADGSERAYRITAVRNPTNEPAGVDVVPTALSLDEGTSANYTLALAAEPVETVTITVRVRGSRSVKASPPRLTFTPANWNSPQTMGVQAQTDADESNESAMLVHAATGAGYDSVAIQAVGVVVTDDNTAWSPRNFQLDVYADRLEMVFDRKLDTNSVPPKDDFGVKVGDEVIDITEIVISGNTLTLKLGRMLVGGESVSLSYSLQNIRGVPEVGAAAALSTRVLLFESASNPDRQGFVRIINHSDEDGEVSIEAVDDAGVHAGPVSLEIGAGEATHFNAGDLETGNPNKGIADGIGMASRGNWRLDVASELDIEVLSYARTTDGFVTSLHDSITIEPGAQGVAVFFNPGENANQVSHLRLVNPGTSDAMATIEGTDDDGEAHGEVRVSVPAGTSVGLTADELESGTGSGIREGALGDGKGKWRLRIDSDAPIIGMSLLESQGRLTNLSTAPRTSGVAEGSLLVPLFPSASDPNLEGFVRVINHSMDAGDVSIEAFDDTDRDYETVTLALGAGEARHFNSGDLELGNQAKGLQGSTGSGTGDWRLEVSSALDIEVLAYIRTGDGFVTAMHDLAPVADGVYRVVFLNPEGNVNQVSRLRLINPGTEDASVTITGIDDAGESPGDPVRATVRAGASLALSSVDLESGNGDGIEAGGIDTLDGSRGKWRLGIESDQAIHVMSLLKSPTEHLTNLSTSPGRDDDGSDGQSTLVKLPDQGATSGDVYDFVIE